MMMNIAFLDFNISKRYNLFPNLLYVIINLYVFNAQIFSLKSAFLNRVQGSALKKKKKLCKIFL